MRTLRIGEEVLGRDGGRLGTLERLVVEEQAHRVTHLVVGGHLLGIDHVRDPDGDRLVADVDGDQLARRPEAQPELVSAPGAHWRAPGGYSIEDFLSIASALIGQAPYVPPVHLDVDLSAVHEIAPGSPVFAGPKHVGDVSRVLTDDDGQVSALVLRRPGLIAHRVLLPAAHVIEVVGSAVHVDLNEDQVEALPRY